MLCIWCSGKTTLLNVMAMGHPVETCPTIGLNVKLVKKGGVQMKCWDIGGQAQYRSEWGRYTRGCDVIIYVVDANAVISLKPSMFKFYLSNSLIKFLWHVRNCIACWKTGNLSMVCLSGCEIFGRELATTPLLVLANKIDLEPHISEPELIRGALIRSICVRI